MIRVRSLKLGALTDTSYFDQVNESKPGGNMSLVGLDYPRHKGLIGTAVHLSHELALKAFNTASDYACSLLYVRHKSGSSQAAARGNLAFVASASDASQFIVTPDASTGVLGQVAGVWLNAVTAGNYGWILIGGIFALNYHTGTGTTTGENVTATNASSVGKALSIADATAVTNATQRATIGVALEAPAAGAAKLTLFRSHIYTV